MRKSRRPKGPFYERRDPANGEFCQYHNGLEGGMSWRERIELLPFVFEFEYRSRRGLRGIHKRFEEIHGILDQEYEESESLPRMRGTIVCVWVEMCVADALLQNRLFNEGLSPRLEQVLKLPSTTEIAIPSLAILSFYSTPETLPHLIKLVPNLICAWDESQLSSSNKECALLALSNLVQRVKDPSDLHFIYKHTNTDLFVKLVTPIVVDSDPEYHQGRPGLIAHCLHTIYTCCYDNLTPFMSLPSLYPLAIPLLRANDVVSRCNSLRFLLAWDDIDTEGDGRAYHTSSEATTRRLREEYPPHLQHHISQSRCDRSDMKKTAEGILSLVATFERLSKGSDYLAAGSSVAKYITEIEWLVVPGLVTSANGGPASNEMVGLLELLAHVLRSRGHPKDLDEAYILDIKRLLARGITDASHLLSLCRKAIAHNPDIAYYYMHMSLDSGGSGGNCEDEIVYWERKAWWMQRGLRAKFITPYVRSYLLAQSANFLSQAGLALLSRSLFDNTRLAQGVAFLVTALHNAKAFLDITPPDDRRRERVICWAIIIILALWDGGISSNPGELKGMIQQLKIAVSFKQFLIPDTKPPSHLTFSAFLLSRILPIYSAPSMPHVHFLSRINRERRPYAERNIETAKELAGKNVAAWFEAASARWGGKLKRKGGETAKGDGRLDTKGIGHVNVEDFDVGVFDHPEFDELEDCERCGKVSAALKRCAGCEMQWYCSRHCQKADWLKHRGFCKTIMFAPSEGSS